MWDKYGDPHWAIRRRLIILTLIGTSIQIAYITVFGADTRLNETLALGAYGVFSTTLGCYVFGAVWDDKGRFRAPRDPVNADRPHPEE